MSLIRLGLNAEPIVSPVFGVGVDQVMRVTGWIQFPPAAAACIQSVYQCVHRPSH